MFQNEEQRLEALRLLVASKYPCEYRTFLRNLYKKCVAGEMEIGIEQIIVCDARCSIRDLVFDIIRDEFGDEKMKKYDEEMYDTDT